MIDNSMSPSSKVWVYQSNREFTSAEVEKIREEGVNFVKGWTSHDVPLKAAFEVRYNRFLVFIVDEEQSSSAGGCSIDKSVHLLRKLEQQYGVTLFDRLNFAYRNGDKVLSCNREQFEKLVESGTINDDTIVFNNLVANKQELDSSWEIPMKMSWHKSIL